MTAIIETTNAINGTNWRGFTGTAFNFTCGNFANIEAAQSFLSCDTVLSDHSGHSSGPGTSQGTDQSDSMAKAICFAERFKFADRWLFFCLKIWKVGGLGGHTRLKPVRSQFDPNTFH